MIQYLVTNPFILPLLSNFNKLLKQKKNKLKKLYFQFFSWTWYIPLNCIFVNRSIVHEQKFYIQNHNRNLSNNLFNFTKII